MRTMLCHCGYEDSSKVMHFETQCRRAQRDESRLKRGPGTRQRDAQSQSMAPIVMQNMQTGQFQTDLATTQLNHGE